MTQLCAEPVCRCPTDLLSRKPVGVLLAPGGGGLSLAERGRLALRPSALTGLPGRAGLCLHGRKKPLSSNDTEHINKHCLYAALRNRGVSGSAALRVKIADHAVNQP